MSLLSKLSVFALTATTLVSCQKMVVTGPTPTSTTATGSMQVSSSSLAVQLQAGLNSADTSLKWTSVVVFASTVTLDIKKGDSSVHFTATPNCKIDLLHPDHSDTIRIPEGHFGHVDFKFLLRKGNVPSLRLQGVYTANGVSTPIVMEIAEDIELKGSLDSFTINRNTLHVATTKLPLALIASGITHADLDAATRTNTGSIVISPYTNAALYKQIIANFKLAMEQYFH